jgi:5'-3' exonuclease
MLTKVTPNASIRGALVDFISNTKIIQDTGLKTAIIDADSILFAICVDKKQDDYQIAHFGAQTERTLNDVIEEFNTYFLRVLMDSGCIQYVAFLTAGSHRYSFYPEYKANRKKLEKPRFLKELTAYAIETLGFCRVDGYEADDLVNMCKEQLGDNTLIVHTDKDLDQIPGNHFNYKKPEFYDVSEDTAQLNLWTQVITGDSIDNIKGIPGKGAKFAEEIFSGIEVMDYKCEVLIHYTIKFGEYQGIEEFTKNYKLIKLLGLGNSGLFFQTSLVEDKLDLEANLNL